MLVLIVDDEPLAQTALGNILSARSDVEHFDSANDASEALKKLATCSYDMHGGWRAAVPPSRRRPDVVQDGTGDELGRGSRGVPRGGGTPVRAGLGRGQASFGRLSPCPPCC
jgi:hypothetical protein